MKQSHSLKHITVQFSKYFMTHLPLLNQHLSKKVSFSLLIFYEFFTYYSSALGHRVQREELDAVLVLLEKILLLLPELLQKRWQKHALTRLFKRLLHPANNSKLRRDSMK